MLYDANVFDVAYLTCDSSLTIVDASSNAASMLQSEHEMLIGKQLSDVCLPLIGSEEQLVAVLQGTQPHMSLPQVNIQIRPTERRYVSFTALPASLHTLLIIIKDETMLSVQQQRIQQQHHELLLLHEQVERQNHQLTMTNQQLSELSQHKSDVLAVATHDLRSPLSAILSYIELLKDGEFDDLTESQLSAITVIERQGKQMLDLIAGLLDLKRIENPNQEQFYPINICELINQVIISFQDRAYLAQVFIAPLIGCEVSPVPIIMGDRLILQQVIANLLSNGIKYGGKGCVMTLSLEVRPLSVKTVEETTTMPLVPSANVDHWCVLHIADTGPGLSEQELTRIFDPFYRTLNAKQSKREGSGLGLTIVQRAVQAHGGLIDANSTPGVGTTFHISLPCQLVPQLHTQSLNHEE